MTMSRMSCWSDEAGLGKSKENPPVSWTLEGHSLGNSRLPLMFFVSRSRFYLLRISAFNLRIIASRLSDGSAPVITSMRSPRCMAMVRSP